MFGWTRTGWLIVLIYGGAILFEAAFYLMLNGGSVEAGRAIIRATAWSSIIAFLIAYSARPAHQLLRTKLTKAALANRRYWGVSFFVSHMVHLAAIIYVFDAEYGGDWTQHAPPSLLVGGGLCYVLLIAMALTSTDDARKRLGKNWKRLHWVGMHYAWVVFAQNYVVSMVVLPHDNYWRTYIFGPLLLIGLGLRITAFLKQRQPAV